LSPVYLLNSLASLLKVNSYNHTPLYVSTWGPFSRSAHVWCVQVMLYDKKLSYGVHVIRHMYHAAPQATLDTGVQDVAHQALTAFCQELQDIDNQRLNEKEKQYVKEIEDLQAWGRVQERNIQSLQALSSAQKAIIRSLRG
jgi:hypothetical protein